ncbi:MAG TPA: maleylpyruvate isomerase family mycothiol-dependent enzyme [Acidimicrobiia bacterium]
MTADAQLDALARSVEHLRALVAPLDDAAITRPAFPAEWTIADVLSHVGSSAVIHERNLDEALAGTKISEDFAPSVWDTWDAKRARAKVDDGLAADASVLARLQQVDVDRRAALQLSLGPLTVDFPGFVALRLNEHLLHTWDVEVALDPRAVLQPHAVPFVVDGLGLIARYTGRPTGERRTIRVATSDPVRRFAVELAPDAVAFEMGSTDVAPDVELPAEAWIRLVYGRLDPEHTPRVDDPTGVLDELRRIYPGP